MPSGKKWLQILESLLYISPLPWNLVLWVLSALGVLFASKQAFFVFYLNFINFLASALVSCKVFHPTWKRRFLYSILLFCRFMVSFQENCFYLFYYRFERFVGSIFFLLIASSILIIHMQDLSYLSPCLSSCFLNPFICIVHAYLTSALLFTSKMLVFVLLILIWF